MRTTSFTEIWHQVNLSFYFLKQQKKMSLYLHFDYDKLEISFSSAITAEVDAICGQKT